MTKRDIATLRAALTAGINAVCDVLDAAATAANQRRAIVRPAAQQPDNDNGEPDELAQRRAEDVMRKNGMRT